MVNGCALLFSCCINSTLVVDIVFIMYHLDIIFCQNIKEINGTQHCLYTNTAATSDKEDSQLITNIQHLLWLYRVKRWQLVESLPHSTAGPSSDLTLETVWWSLQMFPVIGWFSLGHLISSHLQKVCRLID